MILDQFHRLCHNSSADQSSFLAVVAEPTESDDGVRAGVLANCSLGVFGWIYAVVILDRVVAFGEDVASFLADVSDCAFGSILARQGLRL